MRKLLGMVYFMIVCFCFNSINASSGGPLSQEQASYDVKYYELSLKIAPEERVIGGSLLCLAEVVQELSQFVLDLSSVYLIDSVLIKNEYEKFVQVNFKHENGKIAIPLQEKLQVGRFVDIKVFYNGKPKRAEYPPWDDGFVWKKTASGSHWIGVACEGGGGDIWWPCKDHPSDESDSMRLFFTVPNDLKCASNGKLVGTTENEDSTTTFEWFVSTPINNYNVTLYIADYKLIEDNYLSISGKTIPFEFWVLPEYYEKALAYMDVFKKEFDYLESICGPFPFGTDKHGWAYSPYWGMEHQSIIAYGDDFTTNRYGYDYIHYHELAHEWWGNLITAKDWADLWIHEGLATYMEALYVEHLFGKKKYFEFIKGITPRNQHTSPLAPRKQITADEAFDDLNSYHRGAATMHTLRYHLGEDKFFNLLKRWAYPDSTDFDNTNGRQCRLYTTDDMKEKAELITGVDLDPFFDAFMRETKFPQLSLIRNEDEALFEWKTKNDVPLDLSVQVSVNGVIQVVEMIDGKGKAEINGSDVINIDPYKWILMGTPVITSCDEAERKVMKYELEQNFPNPFNPSTNINFSIAERGKVSIKIYNMLGEEISELANKTMEAGDHSIEFKASNLPSGTYFCRMQAGSYSETSKMLLIK